MPLECVLKSRLAVVVAHGPLDWIRSIGPPARRVGWLLGYVGRWFGVSCFDIVHSLVEEFVELGMFVASMD